MKLTLDIPRPPVIQIALDYATIDEAIAMAKIGIAAGVDWLEIGTPLIVSQGVAPIGQMVRAFPDYPVLADYKTMDSGWKNVQRTAEQGGHVMTVCANAPDETVRSAIAESKELGRVGRGRHDRRQGPAGAGPAMRRVGRRHDLPALRRRPAQSRRHARLDPMARSGTAGRCRYRSAWAAFCAEDGVRAARLGAELIAIGHPVISAADPLAELTRFVREVKAAYRPRSK